MAMSQVVDEPAGPQQAKQVKLGEELPLFCERCGYSLHGAPQLRCDHCALPHFQCAECGHRQHINTLRPAVARWLGRLRAVMLGFGVFFKLNYFGWLLFAWAAMGYEWVFTYSWTRTANAAGAVTQTTVLQMRGMEPEAVAAFLCFGLAFGIVSRLLLMKWKRSWAVGVVLAALAAAATVAGAAFRHWELVDRTRRYGQGPELPGWE